MGIGGFLGLATGAAMKWIGRMALIIVGLIVLSVQLLSAAGVISVDWLKLQALAEPLYAQRGQWWSQLISILTANLPFGGSFLAGLAMGLRF